MYKTKIIATLDLLRKNHPKVNIGKHIANALDGHDVWSISDQKFYELISNYQTLLDAVEIVDDNFDIDKIIEDGLSIGK